ncbi:MAG: hypothetical protein PWP52_734 [Bacteroidales bacterium]|nr:hypothetical protein [Bacteroidales bacterium]
MFAQFTDIHYICLYNDKTKDTMNILDFAINYPDEKPVGKNSNNKETKWV